MKILVVSQYYYPEPFKINEICEGFVKKGNSVTVLTGIPNYPSGIYYNHYSNKRIVETLNGVKVIRCKTRARKKGFFNLFLNYISFWKSSKKEVKRIREKFDVVFVWQLSPVFYIDSARVYAKKHHTKVFCYCMDLWPESLLAAGINKNSLIYKIAYHLSKKLYLSCDRIFCSSPSFQEYFKTYIGFNKETLYLPQPYSPKFEITKNNKINKLPVFLYAGNIGTSQKIDKICKALSKVDCIFWIYGDGSELKKCKDAVEKLNNQNSIFFGLVSQSSLKEAYSLCDFFVLPLASKTFVGNTIPAKLLEYLYYEKPILGAVQGDSKIILENIGNTSFCNLEDEQSVVDAANDLINNKRKYYLKVIDGKKYFYDNFTLQKHLDLLLTSFAEATK